MDQHGPDDRAQRLWRDLLDKEQQFFDARMALLIEPDIDPEGLIDRALIDPDQQGAALRQPMFLQEPLPPLISPGDPDGRSRPSSTGSASAARRNPNTGESVAGPVTLPEEELARNRTDLPAEIEAHPLDDE